MSKYYDWIEWVYLLHTLMAGVVLIASYFLIRILKNQEKDSLKVWRETLYMGQKVIVNDGAVKFNAQILHVFEDHVQVMSDEMRVAAYPKEVIYPEV